MDNKQNSDILGYRADLRFKVDSYSKFTEKEYTDDSYIDDNEDFESLSSPVQALILNKPSETIRSLIESGEIYSNIIEEFLKDVSHENFQKYISEDSEEGKQEILKDNFNDIYGSTALESFIEILEIKDLIDKLVREYSFLVYGKETDIKSSSSIDAAYIDSITNYEKANIYSKINYSMIFYDTQISYIIKKLCMDLNELIIDLSSIKDNLDESKATSTDDLKTIQKGFKINNELLEKTLHSKCNSTENLLNHMRKVFNLKDELDIYNNTFNNLFALNEDADMIYEIKVTSEAEIAEFIRAILKISLYINMVRKDISKFLLKKSKFRSFF